MLVPPLNFGIVEENLYRCSKLETLNLSFIENLNLKIVVFIMSEDPGRPFKEFMKSRKIEWIVINPSSYLVTSSKDEKYNDVNSSDSSMEITPSSSGNNDNTNKNEVLNFESNQYISTENYLINNTLFLMHPKIIRMVFNIILDKSNNNILLVDKSALLVGMLRKIQKWQLSSIIDEYRMITGKHKSYNAECFLEFVKIELVQSKNNISNEDDFNSLKNSDDIKDDDEYDDNDNDAEKKYAEKRSIEHQKLQVHNKKILSQLITNKLFETDDDDKTNHGNNQDEKVNVLIEIDLENFNPPVPEYLVDIIDCLESEKKKLENQTAEELKKLDKQEEERKIKMRKKIKDINKYSMKFNKSKKETSQYEYYKSETKSRNTKISKKLIDINAVNESIRKIKNMNERESNHLETELNKMKDSYEKRQQPFTRTKITFEPKPYEDKDEKLKNEALLNEYGIKFCDFPLSADDVSTGKEVVDDKQTVVINIPSENRLQSWFVHKRNIWEDDFVEENHREKIYV
ncbi:uncharacterized protein HGUI_03044 [Hanseniaspora guilliermondii]|uniref:Protein OCA4 n=1 Tax=Hanseniaspora guilliermondii TaxID=56406 RepID=A0A1L0B4U8_9ASCO|nr:uncharacterized protein HGUI_03044 [Hanseniaspora guilliermondii]